jgi:SAM-dependent methyltransferase
MPDSSVAARDLARLSVFYGEMTSVDGVLGGARAAGLDPDHLSAADLYTRGLDLHNLGGYPELDSVACAVEHVAAPPSDDRVLDVGCGLGGPSRFLADRFGCQVTGVDLLPLRVEAATALAQRLGFAGRVEYQVADATSLPFEDGRFDHAWILDVSIHIRDKRRLFGELARVLRAGGLVVVHEQMGPLPPAMLPLKRRAPYFAPSFKQFIAIVEDVGLRVRLWQDTTEMVLAEFYRRRDVLATIDLSSLRGPAAAAVRRGHRLIEGYIETLEGPAGCTGIMVATQGH